ncbi:MAG: glycerol-3-phosphate dehydrogenase C-terminal domain-containing protein, partial [Acidimicrobiales bacterium]
PSACREDVQYLLDTLNGVLRTPVSLSDIESVYVGLRPLIAGAEDQTTKLSREHAVNRPIPGLVLVSGGKYTTYRAMAKDVVDVAMKEELISAAPSLTESYPIVGADGFERAWSDRIRLAKEANLTQPQYERLLHRYGTLVGEVLESSKDDPSALEEISGSGGYLRAEVTYAVTHEGARHLDDVLVRRTRIAMETPDRGTGCSLEVAMLMGRHLGWNQETLDAEVASYGIEVAGDVQAEAQADESAANEIIGKVRPRYELA